MSALQASMVFYTISQASASLGLGYEISSLRDSGVWHFLKGAGGLQVVPEAQNKNSPGISAGGTNHGKQDNHFIRAPEGHLNKLLFRPAIKSQFLFPVFG